jgi:hypothetical protein
MRIGCIGSPPAFSASEKSAFCYSQNALILPGDALFSVLVICVKSEQLLALAQLR